ncbi:MAG: hypothetical protein LAP87_24880 [Acidobacteriia bacterium]|nr:hypothetical protein [Terriglobia bacterium]
MSRYTIAVIACALLVMAGVVQGQGLAGTTSLSLNVPPEAALNITDATTGLSTSGGVFGAPFTGTTGFTYKIRTGSSTTAKITLAVASDFNSTAEPKIAGLPTGDTMTYTSTATAASGAGITTAQPVNSLNNATTVVTFNPQAHSTKAGDAGSVSWTLTNDPVYEVGAFTATVTFTISAT